MIESKEEFNVLINSLKAKRKENKLGKSLQTKLRAFEEVESLINNLTIPVVVWRSEQLKDEDVPNIDDWIKDQGYTQITFSYVYKKAGTYKDKEELFKEYRKEFCL